MSRYLSTKISLININIKWKWYFCINIDLAVQVILKLIFNLFVCQAEAPSGFEWTLLFDANIS